MKKLRFRWSLSSSKLLALTAFYFSAILNYPFYTKVLSIHPLTHTSADLWASDNICIVKRKKFGAKKFTQR